MRESNEDHHIHILNLNNNNKNYNNIDFLAVFDGHGGKTVSKFLKNTIAYHFINKFKEHKKDIFCYPDITSKYINKIFNFIQNKLIEEYPKHAIHCGSTACIVIHYKDLNNQSKLWVLNVGDSRAIKCNKFNIAEQLSQDHKPNSPDERIRIEKLGGVIEFDGSDWRIKNLSLSRAFGDLDCNPYVTHLPQIYEYTVNPKDKFLVVACDGLWDVLSNQDVVDFINIALAQKIKTNLAKLLAEYAIQKGSMDNVTAIVYFF
jgi:serine/threonine protein phosphatase PrpC